jgi:hypothetical protein
METNILVQLNEHLGLINLILSFVVASATLVYSLLTWKITNETKLMREVYTEPRISIYIEEDRNNDGFFDIIIKNIGLGPAFLITFTLKEGNAIDGVSLSSLRRLNSLANGIPYLGPNQEIRSNITYTHNNDAFYDTEFEVDSTYKSALKKEYNDTHVIKYSIFEGTTRVHDTPIESITKSIKKISESIENIADGRKEIKVLTQTIINKEKATKRRILSHRDYLA